MEFQPRGSATFPRAFADSRKRGELLLSNVLAGKVLSEDAIVTGKFWTGTIVAYPAPGRGFGESILLNGSRTAMPLIFDSSFLKGERGSALVMEPGTYDIVPNGHGLLVRPNERPIIVPAFPQEDGWGVADERTGITVKSGKGPRSYLWRFPHEAVVAVVRDLSSEWAIRDIFLNQKPHMPLAFVSSAAETGAPALQ